jgi:signal recognition particle subunit SRP54
VLGEQVGVATLPIIVGQQPVEIATRALHAAKLQAVDVSCSIPPAASTSMPR